MIGSLTGSRTASGLTQRQEAFVLAFIETGNASEAYRRAYSPKRMTAKSVNERASQLLANIKVSSRVAELRTVAADKAVLTLERHMEKMAELRDLAVKDSDWDAAIRAEERRGVAAGLYPDKGRSLNVHVGIPPSSEPVSETSKWLKGMRGTQ